MNINYQTVVTVLLVIIAILQAVIANELGAF
jgi:hypothetical protein